ncbi:MAG: hypothetical protein RL020_1401 [Pseudomonadota bacterium]
MNTFKKFLALLIPLVGLLLASCGGGSTNVADIGTGGTGVATGAGSISGFGSVYVNGVKHKTSSAKITDDDADENDIIGEDKLKVGQVVEIKGKAEDASNSVAESMEKSAEVKGPVDTAYDSATKTIKVMGQTVLIDNNTSVDSNVGPTGLIADLKAGDLVEVHGFRDAAGVITATRIEKQGPVAQYRVRGTITGLDSGKKEFKIGDLTIDYGSAQIVPTNAVLADNIRVRVKAATAPTAGKLTATKVKVKKVEDASKSELEGVITKFTSATDFEINGIKVTTTATTTYPNGSVADLKEGAKVEAKGSVANGVFTASKIEFKSKGDNKGEDSSRLKLSGLVASSVSSATEKSVTVLGQKFLVNDATRFDDRANNTRPFNISNFETVVKNPAHVSITAYKKDADLIATRVDVNKDTGASVQGPLAAGATATSTTLNIQGVDVKIDSGTKFFTGEDRRGGSVADLAAFLAKAPAGTIVKAKSKAAGLATDTSIDATGANQGELELED